MGFLSSIGSIAGNAISPGAGGVVGGLLGGALEGGMQTAGGMQTSAEQQKNALQAAQMSQFRPVGITNTFGTSNFTFDPTTGQMTAANYSLSPMLKEYQDAIMGANRQSLGDTFALQNLGRQYVSASPEEAAQNWLSNQYALLNPLREKAWSNLSTQDFNRGTTGLKVAQSGAFQSANPYATALANAQALQDLQLAAEAEQQGRAATTFGQGLLSSAFQPFTAGLTAAGAVEGMGQQPLELSASLAGRTASAGANAGKYLTLPQAGYSSSGTLLSALGKGLAGYTGDISGLFGGGGGGAVQLGDTSGLDAMSSLWY